MKATRLALVVLLIAIAHAGYSQKAAVKINLIAPLVRTLNLSGEFKVNEQGSVQLGFYYTGYKSGDISYSGFGLTPEYRLYLSDTQAIEGFYVAPYLRYQNLSLEVDAGATSSSKLTTFGGGVVAGRQWVFKERVTFDIFLGPGYNVGSRKEQVGTTPVDSGSFEGFTVRTGVTLGIAF